MICGENLEYWSKCLPLKMDRNSLARIKSFYHDGFNLNTDLNPFFRFENIKYGC